MMEKTVWRWMRVYSVRAETESLCNLRNPEPCMSGGSQFWLLACVSE